MTTNRHPCLPNPRATDDTPADANRRTVAGIAGAVALFMAIVLLSSVVPA